MRPRGSASRALVLLLVELTLLPAAAWANPQGGVVQSGAATIQGVGTAQVDVHQTSPAATISWESFNVGRGETTRFHQPSASAVAINRILDQSPSQIFGALNANGHVYLINPNGILFGRDAQVNVHALVAATSAQADPLANGFDASATSAPGARVESHGTIRTGSGGLVYLVAPHVENGADGVIVAPGGDVMLAAGATVYLADRPDGRGVAVRYTAPGATGGEATSLRDVLASGAVAPLREALVRQAGRIEANAVRERNGRIELYSTGDVALAGGSVTQARGSSERAGGGTLVAFARGDTAVASDAQVDVSATTPEGRGGFAELSASEQVSLSGDLRADGDGGRILVDPAQATLDGTTSVTASLVDVWATDRVTVRGNVNLNAGSARPQDQRLSLRSGGDVVFENGATIVDDGTSGKRWNVDVVAGAAAPEDAARDDVKAWSAIGQNGGVYLGGAVHDASGRRTSVGSATGELRVKTGDVKLRAQGDLVIGTGGGIRNERGAIDVEVGGDVELRSSTIAATSTTQHLATDAVIENGSGSVRVVAGGSVRLGTDPARKTNAAIRTRGVASTRSEVDPSTGATTTWSQRTNGGSIRVEARGLRPDSGDVDAGIGNRWLQPPRSVDRTGTFDPLFVVSNGILGIGSEAGGDVTVVAARDVLTGRSTLARSGGTADTRPSPSSPSAPPATEYNGAHIGLFGGAYEWLSSDRNRVRTPAGAPAGRLVVVAGRDLVGDTVVRRGDAVLRAGYAPRAGESVDSIASGGAIDARLFPSAIALADPTRGWAGPLARPLTVDLMDGRLDVRGRNGVAIRAIESPSLVYAPSFAGTFRAPGFEQTDSVLLEAETGDVVLVGNDLLLPRQTGDTSQAGVTPTRDEVNPLALLLPPGLTVRTHDFVRGREQRGGDLVLLNDFTLFPSTVQGLTLDVAGKARTANLTTSNVPAVATLEITSSGPSAHASIDLAGPIELVDPLTGVRFQTGGIRIARRVDAQPAKAQSLTVRVATDASVTIPAGTRIVGPNGLVYVTDTFVAIPDGTQVRSRAQVTFLRKEASTTEVVVPVDAVQFVSSDGTTHYRPLREVRFAPGALFATVEVESLEQTPVPPVIDAFGLRLDSSTPAASFDRSEYVYATNPSPAYSTLASREATISVSSVDAGLNRVLPGQPWAFETPISGVELLRNPGFVQGADAATTGASLNPGQSAAATTPGPFPRSAAGHALQLADTSILPAGVRAEDLQIVATNVTGGAVVPAVFRVLQVARDANGEIVETRVDTRASEVQVVTGESVWLRDTTTPDDLSAGILQSDADPFFDGRGNLAFDYASYYRRCHAGVRCASSETATGLIDPSTNRTVRSGSVATHASDPTPASLSARGGFERVRLQLAEPATLVTDGDLVDLQLATQHARSTHVTRVSAPRGRASFGAEPRRVVDASGGLIEIAPDAGSGIEVGGPGSLEVTVGVEPFDQADRNGDGFLTRDELTLGADEIAALDVEPVGFPDGRLSRSELPWVPVTGGGGIRMAAAGSSSAFGIKSVGNFRNVGLPIGGASVSVIASGDVSLDGRGAIGSVQGGDVTVRSTLGALRGGTPAAGFRGQRGVLAIFAEPGRGQGLQPAATTGGGDVAVTALRDVDVGGLAIVALSGGSIVLQSIAGSVDGGLASPFANPGVTVNPNTGVAEAEFEGGGIAAPGGGVQVLARRDVRIGAGILAGSSVNVSAGGSVVAGQGAISSGGSVSVSAGGSISGNISAAGNVSLSGTSAGGANVSSGGIATGTGGATQATSQAQQSTASAGEDVSRASEPGLRDGVGSGPAGSGKRATRIDVQSRACSDAEITSGVCAG